MGGREGGGGDEVDYSGKGAAYAKRGRGMKNTQRGIAAFVAHDGVSRNVARQKSERGICSLKVADNNACLMLVRAMRDAQG